MLSYSASPAGYIHGIFLLQVLANTRVPASQIALYYYVGFCYLMMRRYQVPSNG